MKRIHIYLLLALIITTSCKKTKKKDKANDEVASTQLTKEQVKLLLDSAVTYVDITWDSLIVQDDNKMKDIKRLLDEVSYNNSSNEIQLKKIYALYDSVLAVRYTLDNLNDAKIDEYDEIQNRLITATNQITESTPNIEGQPLAIELMNDISEADGMVFSSRGDYDVWAKKVNAALSENEESIKELGEPYTNYKQLGTFEPEDGH